MNYRDAQTAAALVAGLDGHEFNGESVTVGAKTAAKIAEQAADTARQTAVEATPVVTTPANTVPTPVDPPTGGFVVANPYASDHIDVDALIGNILTGAHQSQKL
jgi:hypothetical protein